MSGDLSTLFGWGVFDFHDGARMIQSCAAYVSPRYGPLDHQGKSGVFRMSLGKTLSAVPVVLAKLKMAAVGKVPESSEPYNLIAGGGKVSCETAIAHSMEADRHACDFPTDFLIQSMRNRLRLRNASAARRCAFKSVCRTWCLQ
jgi:hypothetical protein